VTDTSNARRRQSFTAFAPPAVSLGRYGPT